MPAKLLLDGFCYNFCYFYKSKFKARGYRVNLQPIFPGENFCNLPEVCISFPFAIVIYKETRQW